MRISDWSSDVCSSDLVTIDFIGKPRAVTEAELFQLTVVEATHLIRGVGGRIAPRTEEVLHSELKRLLVLGRAFKGLAGLLVLRSEEHTSELQSLMRISFAVFCLNKQNIQQKKHTTN